MSANANLANFYLLVKNLVFLVIKKGTLTNYQQICQKINKKGFYFLYIYVFQMPKFYSICSVWTSCEFFVSHCILRGLRRPLYLFFFLCISPSLPSLPLSLQPETLLPKTSFFPKCQTRLCRNPRIHRRPIIYSVEKNFAIRWDRTRVLSVQKRSC